MTKTVAERGFYVPPHIERQVAQIEAERDRYKAERDRYKVQLARVLIRRR